MSRIKSVLDTPFTDLLTTATSGDYGDHSENRLTQIFIACFNASARFRKISLRFFGVTNIKSNAISAASQIRQDNGWLDISVYSKERLILVIENKIEAALTSEQLRKYSNSLKSAKVTKVALVKHRDVPSVNPGWNILHWSALYAELWQATSGNSNKHSIDNIIISSFLNVLKELNMDFPATIPKRDIDKMAIDLWVLCRTPTKDVALTRFDVFEQASVFKRYLAAIVEIARADPVISKAAEKPRFGKCVYLSNWESDNPDVEAQLNISIVSNIPLRTTRGENVTLGAGIHISPNGRWKIVTYLLHDYTNWKPIKTIYSDSKKIDIHFDKLRKLVIDNWRSYSRHYAK